MNLDIDESYSILEDFESTDSESLPEDFQRSEQEQKNSQMEYFRDLAQITLDPNQLIVKLQLWQSQCSICRSELYRCQCSRESQQQIHDQTNEIERLIRLERYSGCFGCYLPQSICSKWEDKIGGGYQLVRGQSECQFPGVLSTFLASKLVNQDR